MGMLDDFDIAGASDNPFDLGDGTYRGVVADFIRTEGTTATGYNYRGLQATLKPDDDIPYDHYMPLPTEADNDKAKSFKLSAIKTFLKGCGVPIDRMNTVGKDDMIGLKIEFKLFTKPPNKQGKVYRDVQIRLQSGSPVATQAAVQAVPQVVNVTSMGSPIADSNIEVDGFGI